MSSYRLGTGDTNLPLWPEMPDRVQETPRIEHSHVQNISMVSTFKTIQNRNKSLYLGIMTEATLGSNGMYAPLRLAMELIQMERRRVVITNTYTVWKKLTEFDFHSLPESYTAQGFMCASNCTEDDSGYVVNSVKPYSCEVDKEKPSILKGKPEAANVIVTGVDCG